MKRELNYDRLKRLTNVVHSAYKNSVWETTASFGYQLNVAGQRTNITVQGSNYARPAAWEFGYDVLGQVTSGHKRFDDGSLAAGLQFDYTFDDIGNRKSSSVSGGQTGLQQRSSAYSINPLNQYSSRSVPNYTSVSGTANSDAQVTLIDSAGNYARALRQGEHFFGELPVNNSTGAVWLTITNFAVLDSGAQQITTNINGSVLVPPAQQVFPHDLDGNLTNDAVWIYVWDGENRLIRMESVISVPVGAKRKLEFKYDPQGRRIQKDVYVLNTSTLNYELSARSKFIYDGWNLLAVLNDDSSLKLSFMWGTDMSGTLQGAGGVGGLLGLTSYSGQPSTHVVSVDGNGNVVGLTDIASGEITAVYEYGPFGEPTRVSGTMARENPLRFSSKYEDDEGNLLYYGVRYFRSLLGSWLNRDPLGEDGGCNLYRFVLNSPANFIDALGLQQLAAAPPVPVGYLRVYSPPSNIIPFPGTTRSPSIGGMGALIAGWPLLLAQWPEIMNQAIYDYNGLPRPNQYPYGQDAVDQFMSPFESDASIDDIRENARMMEELLLADKVVLNNKQTTDSRTCCKFIWSKFQLGGWPEHDDYSARMFGMRSELIVVARDGDTARYDGGFSYPEPITTASEVKTGRRWSAAPRTKWSGVQSNIFQRDMRQFERQERVAKKCNLQYLILFKEQPGYQGYMGNGGRFASYMQHRP